MKNESGRCTLDTGRFTVVAGAPTMNRYVVEKWEKRSRVVCALWREGELVIESGPHYQSRI